eukprot:11632066-Karenia_brevis.AAC.1
MMLTVMITMMMLTMMVMVMVMMMMMMMMIMVMTGHHNEGANSVWPSLYLHHDGGAKLNPANQG